MSIKNFYEFLPEHKPKSIVIMLHGVGSNGQDLISLAPYLAQKLPNTVFVSPDAPFVCDMVPAGYPNAYQWFSLQNREPHIMLEGAKTVYPVLEEFIDEQLKRFDLKHEKLALLGFSQGTMTSLYSAPRLNNQIAGVLGYSGALLRGSSGKHVMPIHLIHGEADDVVPVQAREIAEKTLSEQGFAVTGYTTPNLPHSIDQEGIESGSKFLKGILS